MGLPLYLAMTAAEFTACSSLPATPAWMACHFSPYGTGLTNLPPALPENAMVILNDRIPPSGQDPALILQQLRGLAPSCVLLDFQRPNTDESAILVRFLQEKLEVPLGVAELYGKLGDGPVFLPPVPPDLPPEVYLAPWKGREIWLEAAFTTAAWSITEAGAAPLPLKSLPEQGFTDPELCCHYRVLPGEERVTVSLWRTGEDLAHLLEKVSALGVTRAVGLWQELGGKL